MHSKYAIVRVCLLDNILWWPLTIIRWRAFLLFTILCTIIVSAFFAVLLAILSFLIIIVFLRLNFCAFCLHHSGDCWTS